MCAKFSAEELCKSSSDQTGKFPITSSRGHKYIFLFYHYATNTINGIAIKSSNMTDISDAWKTAYDQLKSTKYAHSRQRIFQRHEDNLQRGPNRVPTGSTTYTPA